VVFEPRGLTYHQAVPMLLFAEGQPVARSAARQRLLSCGWRRELSLQPRVAGAV